jgi:hypothetical protein
MVLESTQFNQLVQEVREALELSSQGVNEVEVVASLANVVSLPAYHLEGDKAKVVHAPIELLSAPAVEAAIGANKATENAIIATVEASAAADLAEAERKDLDDIKQRTITAGIDAYIKGDKAFHGAITAENATLYAMQMAFHLQSMLEAAQVVILSGEANEEKMRNLDLQVKDSILVCTHTRNDAYAAILQLRELQQQIAQVIVNAYVVADGMKLSTSDARQATVLANRAAQRICELSERTERVIIESVIQTEKSMASVIRLEDLAKDVMLSKMEADIAASHAEANAKLAKQATDDAKLANQEAIIVTDEAKKVIQEAEAAIRKTIFSAGSADSAAGYATQQGDAAKMAAERSNTLSDHPDKIINDEWYKYDEESGEYVATGIQAKGNTGASFRVLRNYETLDLLIAAVPDGTGVDGVYGVGAAPPYTYYAWTLIDNVWGWHSQGMLQGQRGESAYEAAVRIAGYEGTEEEYVASPILNAELALEAAKKAGKDTSAFLEAAGKSVTDAVSRMTELSDNPMKIVDGVWHKYDEESAKYVSTGIRAVPIDWQVRDLDHEPTEADLTYHDEATGLDVPYPIGAEVRVWDAEYEEYDFYKLYDVKDGKAAWDTVGGGMTLPTDIILGSPTSFDDAEGLIFLDNGILTAN